MFIKIVTVLNNTSMSDTLEKLVSTLYELIEQVKSIENIVSSRLVQDTDFTCSDEDAISESLNHFAKIYEQVHKLNKFNT